MDKKETLVQGDFNFRIKLMYERSFNQLKNRTRNVLKDIGADNIRIFSQTIMKNDAQDFIMGLKNCGVLTRDEIIEFRKKVKEIIYDNNKYLGTNGLFADFQICIDEGNKLTDTELEVLYHYYGFTQIKRKRTLTDISRKVGLSRERVRQIANEVLVKIRKMTTYVLSKGDYDLHCYLDKDYFIVDEKFKDRINAREKTNFNGAFISYVLECVQHPEYSFIPLEKKLRNYSGIFIKKPVPLDFKKCVRYLSKFIDVRRKNDIGVEFDFLLGSFRKISNKGLIGKGPGIRRNERIKIAGILRLFAKYYMPVDDNIKVNPDSIVFKRNTKKLTYEYLRDILNDYRKPMHFGDLYNQCRKRRMKIKSPISVLAAMNQRPEIFGRKGLGIYGLHEWGGLFGYLGDAAEKILQERGRPINIGKLEDILCREFCVSRKSIKIMLFRYKPENRFVKLKNDTIGLKSWSK